MALIIKNRDIEKNARELAQLTGKPLTQAVNDALSREIKREKAIKTAPLSQGFWDEIRAIQARVAALHVRDHQQTNDILYDEFGLPK